MRIRLLMTLVIVAAACGEASPVPTEAPPQTTVAPPTTAGSTAPPSTAEPTTTVISTTAPPIDSEATSFREEWRIETTRGVIIVLGEHTATADRWVERYGADPGSLVREVIVAGDEVWSRYADQDWELTSQFGVPTDLLNEHPFEASDITSQFELVGTETYQGRDVTWYRATGDVVAAFTGTDTTRVTVAEADVALYGDGSFANYEMYFEWEDAETARLTYRTYDLDEAIIIDLPELALPTCRDRGNQLIDEVGAYRSRYELRHPGAAFSSIEELRLLDPWAWQRTVRFADQEEFYVETLWVDGGATFWRLPGQDWQVDDEFTYQSMTHRPFVDDLWIPDVVGQLTPVGQAELAGRGVDVYELGIEDVRGLNASLADNTDTLEATLWIEECWSPELVKLEVVATGPGYVEGLFHITYELFDLGTSDTIDIPAEALPG